MDNFIMLFAILANIIAILLVYYSFGRKMDKQKRFMNTLIGMGFICILVWLVFSLSSIGIEKISALDKAKTLLTIAFVPVDAILFIPISVISFNKSKEKKITEKSFYTRMTIIVILAIIVMICEFFYFRNFQKDIVRLNEEIKVNQEIKTNSENNNALNENDVSNEVNEVNEITNEIENVLENNI